ncbi:hypothetical protein CEXT_651501 [Caerostris extrusa]|uniref:Uncharacterized protein n=1 Tax=Caerostris extrusa TaxID=172846 RepID=A0AAV4PY33_CAEEX|nr:hypothetical protein CEXT_651501 [Caerostris extrusa]
MKLASRSPYLSAAHETSAPTLYYQRCVVITLCSYWCCCRCYRLRKDMQPPEGQTQYSQIRQQLEKGRDRLVGKLYTKIMYQFLGTSRHGLTLLTSLNEEEKNTAGRPIECRSCQCWRYRLGIIAWSCSCHLTGSQHNVHWTG